MKAGFAAQLAEQVPEREVDARNRVHDQPLAPIILGCDIHLVPDLLILRRAAADQEAGEMPFDDEAGRLAARRYREADRAVLGLDLDDQRAEPGDPQPLTRGPHFVIAPHRVPAMGDATWN